ncbi:hypothetical protein JCM19301_2327 [Jejuia pallidilutea]|uniref:Uncharacterized protein n=1 Tax=Jejuia pallidilutea TaxID=504487 RepID=A0A090WI40_9FLAO|nr:hypothetical protein JCM19301_2327 [Jejuia pallidilutea]
MEIKYPVAFVTAFHETSELMDIPVAPFTGNESVVQLGNKLSTVKRSSVHPVAFPEPS